MILMSRCSLHLIECLKQTPMRWSYCAVYTAFLPSMSSIHPRHASLKAVTSLSVCALPLLYTWQERLLVGCAHCCAQLQTLVAACYG